MADAKLTALSAIGTLGTDDLFYVVDDPGGSPLSRKATGTQVRALVHAAPVTLTFEDATANTVITDLILQRTSSAAPGAGIGVAQEFVVETAAANNETIAKISAITTDVGTGVEDADFLVQTFQNGALFDRFKLTQSAFIASFGDETVNCEIRSTVAGTDGPRFVLVHDGTTPAAGDNTRFSFVHNDSGLTETTNMTLQCFVTDPADGNETAVMLLNCIQGGSLAVTQLEVSGSAGATFQVLNATTNAVTNIGHLRIGSIGTPANGIGAGLEYVVETTTDNYEIGTVIEAAATDVAAASEDFTWRVKTMTAGQAAAVSLSVSLPGTVYPQGHLFGLTLSNDAGDTTNDINITAGEAVDETGVWNMTLASETTKRIDATWVVGNDQGGMANNGTGVADTTWYEVLLIGREDTRVVDVAFSTTANRAVLPTSYTHKRRIGWVRRGASTNLQFTQVDDYVTLTTQINDASTSITATAAALTLTVPPSSIARFRASLLLTAQTIANETVTVFSEIVEGNVTPAGSTGIASLGAGAQNATSANNDFTSAGHFELRVSSTSTIEHDSVVGAGAAGTHDVSTFGWIDHRRRMSAT